MDEEKDQLLAELTRLRARAEEIGKRLRELEKKERRSRLRVLPGGAAALVALGSTRKAMSEATVVTVATVAFLIAFPVGEVSRAPQDAPSIAWSPTPPRMDTPTFPNPVALDPGVLDTRGLPGIEYASFAPVEAGEEETGEPEDRSAAETSPEPGSTSPSPDPGPVPEPEPSPGPVPDLDDPPTTPVEDDPGRSPSLLLLEVRIDPALRAELELNQFPGNVL